MSEQEKFYEEANDFIDRNRLELQLGEAYEKFSFWKSIGTSKLGQLVIVLVLLGLCFGTRWSSKTPFHAAILMVSLGLALLLVVGAIVWKVLSLVYKCARVLAGCLLRVVLVLAVLCNIPCDSLDILVGRHFGR
jgi:hypothetical protein